MKQKLDWTNPDSAMLDALRALNIILLESKNLEECALAEAKTVKTRLDLNDITRPELVDYLKQASIDLLVYKRSQNEK